MAPTVRCSLALIAVLGLVACSSGDGDDSAPLAPDRLSATAALGEKIFDDTSLSASGRLACASCHDRNHAFAGDSVVPMGGIGLDVPGFRNAPSLKYLTLNPAFFFDDEGTPTGGFDRDGRAASLAEQASRPFLAAHEMANATTDASPRSQRSCASTCAATQIPTSGIRSIPRLGSRTCSTTCPRS